MMEAEEREWESSNETQEHQSRRTGEYCILPYLVSLVRLLPVGSHWSQESDIREAGCFWQRARLSERTRGQSRHREIVVRGCNTLLNNLFKLTIQYVR